MSAWGRARGAQDRPIPREDVLEKFRKVTAKRLTRAAQDEIISSCDRLETLADATSLVDLLKTR